VGYVYRIGKYEISDSLVNKANVAGNLGITTSDPGYTPPSWGPNKPATHMTWYEAARFVNWLNTSTGHHPAYHFDEQGVWQLWSPSEAWQWDGENLYRHRAAFYFLPSADEWHKAAYYDGSRYWRFPTGSDSRPLPVNGGTDPGTAVYGQPPEAGPADVDNAGGLSPYGTMGQGGNMWEWNESALDGINDSISENIHIRGGRWLTGFTTMRANGTDPYYPWGGVSDATSFRVAARLPLPVLEDQHLTIAEDTATTLTLGPAEAEGFALTYDILEGPAHGTVVLAGPLAHYSPDGDFHGEDRFTFRVSDGALVSEPALVLIDILPVDDPPTLSRIADQILLGRPAQGTVLFTIADVDTPLEALVLTAATDNPALLPAEGLVLGGSGPERTLDLTPTPGSSGEATVTVTVSDGHAQTSTSFRVSVPPRNLPVLEDQHLTIAEDTATTLTLGPAEAEGFALTYDILEGPAHGTVVLEGPLAHYSPDGDFHGEDRFTFRVSDGELVSDPALVLIDILPVDDPPTLSRIADQVLLGRPAQGTVLFTVADVDTPLEALVLTAATDNPALLPAEGLILGGSGPERTLDLTPTPGSSGEATVTVTVSDGHAQTSASFRVAVPPRSLPVLEDQHLTIAEDTATALTLGPAEAEGFALTYDILEGPAHGTVVLEGTLAHYSPDGDFHGEDRFTFRVSDGALVSEPALVLIDILPVDDPPTLSRIADQILLGRPAQGTVLFTIADVDTPLEALVLTAAADNPALLPAEGLVLGGSGPERTLDLTPTPGSSGEATVTVRATDGNAYGSTWFRVFVSAIADSPPPLRLRLSSPQEGAELWLSSRADEDYVVEGSSTVTGPYLRLALVSGTGDWVRLEVGQEPGEPMQFFRVTGFLKAPVSTLGGESGPAGN
jgi:hypothetical protein